MYAVSSDNMLEGITPLAAAAAHAAGGETSGGGAVLIAVSQPDERIHWAVVLSSGGAPVDGPELLHPDEDALIGWLESEGNSGEIEKLVIPARLASRINVRAHVQQLPETDIRPDPAAPFFAARTGPRAAKAGIALAALAAAAAGAAQGWSLWQARETEEPAEQLVAWQEPASPLLEACHSAMRESWPVPPGWALERTGCVTSSMADSGQSSPGGPGEGLAYRIYELSAEHDSRLARAAARELLKEWEGESEVGDTRVTLRRRFDAPLQLSDGRRGSAMRTLRNAVEAEFLGLAEAVTLHGQFLTIRSAASALTLFRRLSDLDRRLPISIRRLTRTQSGMEIELMPKVEIMLPPSG